MTAHKTYEASTVRSGATPSITITTATEDRDGDVILPSGMDATAYRRNPVVLFGHDYSSLPVARSTNLQPVADGIRAEFVWLENDAFADRVKNAFDQGVLRAASIGFRPLASEPRAKGGQTFTRWELLEWSLVPVPANPAAVRTLKSLGLWDDDETVLELDDEPTFKSGRVLNARNHRQLRLAAQKLALASAHMDHAAECVDAVLQSEGRHPDDDSVELPGMDDSDSKELIDFDPSDLVDAIRKAVTEGFRREQRDLGSEIRHAVQREVARSRGRIVDDDLPL